jgi:D-glycero-alpha-D-manno-heptose 1-phosphate guanylyltransferase
MSYFIKNGNAMEAIILAGGLGTRLKSIISDAPKPMAPVQGRPFLEIVLDNLYKKGFRRCILSLGYEAGKITSHFGSYYNGMEICYTFDGAPLGTGGAIRLALTKTISDHIYVLNGDTFLDFDVINIEKLWLSENLPIIVAKFYDKVTRYGLLKTDGTYLTSYNEKSESGSGLINTGCYVFTKNTLDYWPVYKRFSLENDFLSDTKKRGKFRVCQTTSTFLDIGIPDDYIQADIILKDFI